MNLNTGSKTWSCETLGLGLDFMAGQQQPLRQPPPPRVTWFLSEYRTNQRPNRNQSDSAIFPVGFFQMEKP